jgi:hypothetical protein
MKGLLRGIPTLLLSPGKSEIHRLLLPKLCARCKRVVIPVSTEPRIIAPFESEASIAVGTRRLNPSSVHFCYPFIISLENFTLHRQVKTVPIPALPSCTFEYTSDLVTPRILNHGNPIWAIRITPFEEFNPISVIIPPISSDCIDHFLRPISCQKFSVDLLQFIQPFIASHPVEIVDARLNKFDSDEIAMHVELNELLHIRLNELVLVKVESALQAVCVSKFEVSVLANSVFEDNSFYAVTASIKTEFTNHSISTKIQCCEDFFHLSQPNVYAHSHKNPLLQPPNKKPNVLPPINRGGQPRAISHLGRKAKHDPPTARSLREKSEILCEQRGILWRFLDDNEYELQNVDWQNEFVWFKLSGISLNRGRLVKYATNGFYLLIVPSDWICLNIDSPCFEFQQVEQLAIDDWSGYIIRADHDETNFPSFRTTDAAEKSCKWQRTRFGLEGNCINDAPSRLGPLFGLSPPKIKANLLTDWNEVEVIVLGEEGIGRNKAKWQLFPQGTMQIQDLLSKRIEQRSGWYFLRFYDREDNLIESCDFRFVTDLVAIDFPRGLIIPTAHGHESQKIVLRHNKPLSIVSVQHEHVAQHNTETETRLLMLPEPKYDSSEWRLDEKVPAKFELNRLWWGIADENAEEIDIEWQDKPLELEESQFTATSSEVVWIKMPKVAITAVEYGFRRENLRRLPFAHRGGKFTIPLREFSSAPDLQENEANFQLWITELGPNVIPLKYQVMIFSIRKKYWHCKISQCAFSAEEWCQAEAHIIDSHSEYGFRILTYTEAQARGLYGTEFPTNIYQCGHNPQHFVNASSASSNPTSSIIQHIKQECPDARAHAKGGPPQIIFRPVEDVEEIRRVYLPTLPVWAECNFCHQSYEKFTDDLNDDIYSHLIDVHKAELFERR